MNYINDVSLIIFSVILISAAIINIVNGCIYNWSSIAVCALYFACALLFKFGLMNVFWSCVPAIMIIVYFFAHSLIMKEPPMGFGAVKFLSAVSLWFGWSESMFFLLFGTAILLGSFTILLKILLTILPRWDWLVRRQDSVPFAAPLAVAVWFNYPSSPFLQLLLNTA